MYELHLASDTRDVLDAVPCSIGSHLYARSTNMIVVVLLDASLIIAIPLAIIYW